jgi:4-hydroxy-tetrahydrodipicolinate reductase
MTTRIGIAGITGRMGQLLAAEAGADLAGGTSRAAPDLAALAARADVIIDFTHAGTIAPHAAILAAAGTPWVLGTTGGGEAETAAIAAAARHIPVFAAANFSVGVNLVLELARRLAAALPAETHDAEILEMHHRQKRDAPSGTALALAGAIAKGRGVALDSVLVPARQGDAPRRTGEIAIAALRGGQIPGSHTALFTSAEEQITLTHHAFDRRIFARGALRAALWLTTQPPGLYGMADLLGLDTPNP